MDEDEESEEKRYCSICGSELQPQETAAICWNCQAAMLSTGMV
jgi:predicted RNA-binding Zn-ribbon protein involved in translation (DUF1610 family)